MPRGRMQTPQDTTIPDSSELSLPFVGYSMRHFSPSTLASQLDSSGSLHSQPTPAVIRATPSPSVGPLSQWRAATLSGGAEGGFGGPSMLPSGPLHDSPSNLDVFGQLSQIDFNAPASSLSPEQLELLQANFASGRVPISYPAAMMHHATSTLIRQGVSFNVPQPELEDRPREISTPQGMPTPRDEEDSPPKKRASRRKAKDEVEEIEHASDHDGRRKKPRRTPADTSITSGGKKFACPYFKRNRKKYSKWTSCPGPGWDEVHRVKTHLYRRHALPISCPRCWEIFKTDDLRSLHLQRNPPCSVSVNKALVEGFTKDQEKKLRSRKKAQADTTDDDKWREIYTTLFPDDAPESIPSPYYEESDYDGDESSPMNSSKGELEDYATFVRREMPTLVRRELETLFENEFKDIEERLRPRVAKIVLDLQPRLLNLYKQSQQPLSEYGPPSDPPGSDPDLTPATGTGSDSTPGTAGGENLAYEDFGLDMDEILNFDDGSGHLARVWDTPPARTEEPQSAGAGDANNQDFSWDNEFDRLINPSLFMPQDGSISGAYVQPVPMIDGRGQGGVGYGSWR
ncbi:hypothetical protein B0H67DRAFT_580501 [Lasiosphaeris hirsuta]|uniref:C2H2-type domain-containing protein n=1 Tax=Lasiosphaeris hirsuta TaxID=260670 RepID=A0AA40AGG1_9PEZI|nr:hypothetical protein B0H67DRAFT_580501 [Lasiosphaeris hirsuta]